MRIAVFEQIDQNLALLKKYFISYSVRFNIEFDVMWITEDVSEDSINKYACSIDLAYISLENSNGLKQGELLYHHNPDCLICYYKSDDYKIKKLLHTRPINFIVFPINESVFIDMHRKLINEILSSDNFLTLDTRKQLYCICNKNILYIRSDLKYVDILTLDGKTEHIFYKLSDIEKCLKHTFLRIHKSYIVNTIYVASVDKTNHTVKLCDNTELTISAPYYKKVVEFLSDLTR